MPYQTNLDDIVRAERIARLEEIVRTEDDKEAVRQRNIAQNMNPKNVSSDGASVPSGISINTDDIPVDRDPPLAERTINPIPEAEIEWGRWLESGIPNPLTCIELSRLVLIGDFPLMNRGAPGGFCVY